MNIKNDQTVKFWTDVWLSAGKLIDLAGEIGTQKLGIPRNARICDVWNLRASRDQHIQQLVEVIRQFPLSLTVNVPDGVMWRNGPDDYRDKFIASGTWQQIRQSRDEVQWSTIVWFSQRVPRFSFITWLALCDRLSTGHRMHKWGQPQVCILCGESDETRDHLYFACPYTYTLWLKVVGNLFGAEPDPDWGITISRLIT
ncbi:uncharacterized protein LOC125609990 [Brassica napus]|uniref:uncharacterized protein LOC125609990 n=1 Tax=Brassica napus TaxID=3708 RepID=UPI002078EFA0|nr:uncharacterized protein LOC125609990 [Brassica napus]